MVINQANVYAAVDTFEDALTVLLKEVDLLPSLILQKALDHHGSELAQVLIWERQKQSLQWKGKV